MRVKTDVRRDAILAAAMTVFREVGYDRASMAEISARVGGSKATLYSYFKSKEELFAIAMLDAMEERGQELVDILDSYEDDLREILLRFGAAFLSLVTTPEALAITRIAVAEGVSSKLGPSLYERGPKRAWGEVSAYVRKLQDRGKLRSGDTDLMAAQLKGLIEAGYVEPLLWGASPEQAPAGIVAAAVDTFLRTYGVDDKNLVKSEA